MLLYTSFAIFFLFLGMWFSSKQNNNVLDSNIQGVNTLAEHLTPNQFNQALNSGKFKLIDIRTIQEYSEGHIKNAEQIDYYQAQKFSSYLDSLDKNANYLIYCRTGHRSANALQIMHSKGFTNVSDISGGYTAWISAGYSYEK